MNTNEPSRQAELAELCEAAAEGVLTDATRQRLEQWVTSDPAAAQFYAEYLHQHALLGMIAREPQNAFVPKELSPLRRPRLGRWVRIGASVGSMAAMLLIGLWAGERLTTKATTATAAAPAAPSPLPPIVATLTSTKACKWMGATVPTEAGAQLARGRLHLAEGVARLTFASGAEVTLEGPAELELVSRDKCVLTSGRLVARIPLQAIGFLVETSAAVLKDLGTEFGVNVRGPGALDVAVFDGLVDVQERSSGRVHRIQEGNTASVDDKHFVVYPSSDDSPLPATTWSTTAESIDPSRRVVEISDTLGRGAEAFILSGGPPKTDRMNPGVLQIKNVEREDSPAHRKVYVRFDLAPLAGAEVLNAKLELSLVPTPFSSRFANATFAVYGIADDGLDGWDEDDITWQNAPANSPGGAGVDPSKAVLLGRFVVEQGIQQGTFGVQSDALRELLAKNGNQLLTVMVVRETADPDPMGIIHGFASRRHPTAAPPTLKVTVRDLGAGDS